jgi:hypothetical protein
MILNPERRGLFEYASKEYHGQTDLQTTNEETYLGTDSKTLWGTGGTGPVQESKSTLL